MSQRPEGSSSLTGGRQNASRANNRRWRIRIKFPKLVVPSLHVCGRFGIRSGYRPEHMGVKERHVEYQDDVCDSLQVPGAKHETHAST